MSNWQWTSRIIKADDKVCQTYFNTLPDLMSTCLDAEPVLVETPDSENPQLPSLDEQLKRDLAKEELNRVLKVLNMEPIRDDRRVKQIRQQIDNVYWHLRHLCDVLEHNSSQLHDSNSHSLEISESNELLICLKELFKQSSDSEQIRLMTSAPVSWGRDMLSKWFEF